jgi:hypothetical protein
MPSRKSLFPLGLLLATLITGAFLLLPLTLDARRPAR